MIPTEIQAMLDEARRPEHAKLGEMLACPLSVKSFEDGIAIIASYVDVVLHGDYSAHDLTRLAVILCQKLQDKRGAIIVNSIGERS
jgi:hypothetical protein